MTLTWMTMTMGKSSGLGDIYIFFFNLNQNDSCSFGGDDRLVIIVLRDE